MPLHSHPRFRARELVFENEGIFQDRTADNDGVQRLTDAESAGTRPPASTVLALARQGLYWIRGTRVDASTL